MAHRARSLSAELTSVVLLGIGCAANPWGIMIAVLLLDARRGHGIVWAYVVAWIGAITVVLTALLAGFGAIFESGSDSATTAAAVVELIARAALLGLADSSGCSGLVGASSRPPCNPSAPPQLPGWLRAIENISYLAAFLLGIYSATYPLVIAAAGEILRADGSTAETVALAVLFILLGSSSVAAGRARHVRPAVGPVPRAHARLVDRAQPAVITAILLVLGVSSQPAGSGTPLRRVAQALLATALVVAVITGAGSAAATPRAQTVKVAFLQGEQVVYLDRPGSTLTSAFRALVGGPTTAEKAREVTTQIPSGTTVRSGLHQGSRRDRRLERQDRASAVAPRACRRGSFRSSSPPRAFEMCGSSAFR